MRWGSSTPGYARLLKESMLQIWKRGRQPCAREVANAERAAKSMQDRRTDWDEAFLFEHSIDIETYDRHAEKLREELTLARIDRRSGHLQESDGGNEGVVDPRFASWNQVMNWMRTIEELRSDHPNGTLANAVGSLTSNGLRAWNGSA